MGSLLCGTYLMYDIPMEKIDTNYFKKELEKELKTLEFELKTVGHKNPENSADWESDAKETDSEATEEGDVAEGIVEYESNTAILKQLETQYNEVKQALERIASGTYGICEISGETIEPERLKANPSARTCKKHMNEKPGIGIKDK